MKRYLIIYRQGGKAGSKTVSAPTEKLAKETFKHLFAGAHIESVKAL